MMETNHKQFKPFDKVLVRTEYNDGNKWNVDLYSHYSDDHHVCVGMLLVEDNDILPYEGNEHLVGTTDEPEEEIKLKEGEWIMVAERINKLPCTWNLRDFHSTGKTRFKVYSTKTQIEKRSSSLGGKYAIRFSEFNPNNMKETLKRVLCVRDGKIIKYNKSLL